ncbi:MAG TPA: hypothetical protein VN802_13640 [Stellaceae bacterium]|nr:hypothetical protein [Stellaceae bacterium]
MTAGPPRKLNFVKRGLVFRPEGQRAWMVSHAACPVALPLGRDRLRIYFGTRDRRNYGHVAFVEIDPRTPAKILALSDEPAFAPGALGHFDENGVYPGTIMQVGDNLRMYYMGRLNYEGSRYGMAIGVAESTDGGLVFRRLSPAPIFDRNPESPWMVSTPCVMRAGRQWRMWHLGGTGWNDASTKSYYRLKSARSKDGLSWQPEPGDTVPLLTGETNLASPTVLQTGGGWRMWFCTYARTGYRLGYAWSADGDAWTRDDTASGVAPGPDGFDSREMAYPHALEHDGRTYLLYSGNGFGRDGFGLAVAEEAA